MDLIVFGCAFHPLAWTPIGLRSKRGEKIAARQKDVAYCDFAAWYAKPVLVLRRAKQSLVLEQKSRQERYEWIESAWKKYRLLKY